MPAHRSFNRALRPFPAALALLIAACLPAAQAPEPTTEPPAPTPTRTQPPAGLSGVLWELLSVERDGVVATPIAGSAITAEFQADSITGSAGCNQYGALYRIDGAALRVTETYRTLMDCLEEGLLEQEDAYLADLQAATGYALAADRLTVAFEGGRLEYRLVPAAADRLLEGATWQLTTIVTGDVARSLHSDTEVTARFEDEQATGNGSCNQYFARYTAGDGRLSVGPIGATRMACEPDIMAQENDFFAALAAAESYTIEGDQLSLSHPGGALIFTAVDAPDQS